ncbi:MAG: hypothetical protein HY393_04320 [Candidatus Diapherotrites archaeon]|nr:hypothetical protein [Candidatus Diapherotrites archaeon]
MHAEFLAKVRDTASYLKEHSDWVVCHHYDCDGITSGSIITQALRRNGAQVKPFAIKQLYSDTIQQIRQAGSHLIFTDFGSSFIPELREAFGSDFVVIDHHQHGTGKHEWHVNPMEYGLEGSREISAAGISYLVAQEMNAKNRDFAGLAVVGAVGDMQDYETPEGKLMGLNEKIIEDGMEEGVLEKKVDLRLYGRISRPLTQFLMYSTSPILPFLTAQKENCTAFLERNGIPLQENGRWLAYEDLNAEKKKALSTAIILHLNENNVPEWKVRELIGEVYTLKREDPHSALRDAKEFSTVLNACMTPGTEVYLNGKPTPIEEVVDQTAIFSVKNGQIVRDSMMQLHQIPLPEGIPVLEITTKTGRRVSLTANHELMTLKDGEVSWAPAESLSIGNYIAISKLIPEVGKPIDFWDFFSMGDFEHKNEHVRGPLSIKYVKIPLFDKDLGFLLGYIAGDGHVKKTGSGIDIAFSKKPRDKYSFEKIREIMKYKFGIGSCYISEKPTYFNAIWHSTTLSKIIQGFGIPIGKKGNIVSFNKRFLEAEKPVISGILSGLFSSDGNIYKGGVEFSSHSKSLVNQMSYLLQRFGITPHITHRKCPDCPGEKYRLLVCGRTNIQKFVQDIGFPYQETNSKLIETTRQMSTVNSRELYLPVREKLLRLFELFGAPKNWSAHFTYYGKGKQPSIENVRKYLDYFSRCIEKCEKSLKERDFSQMPKNIRFSQTKIAKACGISSAWLMKIRRGKAPGKNANKKLENGFNFYAEKMQVAKKIILEIQQFVDSDIYWDKIEMINECKDRPAFVYDLTIEKNHNYLANGIVVHNCGRHGLATVGLHVCLGDRNEYYQRALALLAEHRKQLAEGINLMLTQGLQEFETFYFFDAREKIKESIVGIVAGMLYGSGAVAGNKPIIAFAHSEDGNIKVSGRGNSELVRRGLNLGKALKETCNELSTYAEGGGHKPAAGCRILAGEKDDFLRVLNEKIRQGYARVQA